ncbi:DNA topoisomerase 3 [Bacillus cereus]|uniref:DNA topoisomerase n=1 Tax=Bacillus cereus TaxID=1396 RepID=A0A9X6VGU0_BACCE|nr:DNA topoisomerase 3 [Bacillus cereus]PFD16699.1 DNA topoisomerase III [Bacillus cereus]PFW60452.1 DNA topoisomerase III [Bacillus sp. AFS075960]
MSNCVILAEKPSQALAYANAMKNSEKKDGYFIIKDSILPNGEAILTFGVGHLVELVPPGHYKQEWEKWNLESLPIFPSSFEFQVAKATQKQFKIVANLLKSAEMIIVGTDPDVEGENIAWSIITEADAYSEDKIYKRLWIKSLEKDAIREGFKNLRNGLDFIPLYQRGKARQLSDWLIGMNGSPLFSMNLQKRGIKGTFSLGRVQTPTLYMIYQRQQEIENFKKEPFFELEGVIAAKQGNFKALLSPSERFKNEAEAITFINEKNAQKGVQDGIIKNVEKKEKKTGSPSLFSLSSLQSKINQMYKASASDTLKAVQKLYEARLLTYPRTDTPFITKNEFSYLKANLDSYKSFLNINLDTPHLEPRKKYVDETKVQEHYAIILTKQVPSKEKFEGLSELQQKIYMLIARTTVAMFLPDYKFEETVIEVQTGELIFKAKGQVPLEQGWKLLFSNESNEEEKKEKESVLPNVQKDEDVKVDIHLVQKETQPPKLFTEGTIITAMKTAGKTVDDEEAQKLLKEIEGIGTEATRADILETLKKKEYIGSQKNNLIVTEKGKVLCRAVEGEKLLTSAEMTAKWETYLKKIERKEGNVETFLTNIQKFIVHLIEQVPDYIKTLDIKEYEVQKQKEEEKSIVGKCPKCGSDIKVRKSFYGCSNYPECKFSLPDNFRKKKLGKTNVKNLLEGKETVIKNIKKADKKTYNAVVKLNEKGFIDFVSFAK